jgi:hypothetical protein
VGYPLRSFGSNKTRDGKMGYAERVASSFQVVFRDLSRGLRPFSDYAIGFVCEEFSST